jgi:hypothetical protein
VSRFDAELGEHTHTLALSRRRVSCGIRLGNLSCASSQSDER